VDRLDDRGLAIVFDTLLNSEREGGEESWREGEGSEEGGDAPVNA